ncbi:MAG: hypothetical protein IKO28_01020 [Prevotella sp.]|nr:hypothetical protein [Prevotella sp.]
MKKLFTFLTLLVAIVTGAQAADEYTLGYPDETVNSCNGTFSGNTATFSVDGKSFTMTRPETDKSISTGNATGGEVKRYGVKFSQNVAYTITLPNGVSVNQIKVGGWANKSDATTSYVRYINDTDVSAESGNSFTGQGTYTEWSYTLPSAVSGSFTITFKGAETVANLTLICGESAPATAPTITTQPQGATYVIGTEDYPSMSVEATASAGELKYQWHIIVSETDVTIPGATTSTLSLATYASSPAFAPYLSQEGAYSIYCNVADDNDNVDSDMATLTVTATAPATTVSAPTFDKTEGAEIKAGDPIIVTSDDGSQIYYNWSKKDTGGYTAEQLLTRTPKDSPASVTTSTTGNRYLYALAKKGDLVSEISILGVKVDPNPVKGLLDKTEDNVEAGTEVEAPVFSVVDAENNPSPASIAYGTATNKDVTVNFAIDPASTNSGIINLKADGSGIESINTTSGGTAIVNITLTSNKDGYPIIDGESGIYTYTITVTGGEPVTVNYTKSVNIEQLVLDNGINYDITKDFAENYVEYASINALDSLNDAKNLRNEPYLGLKLKTAGAYIKVTLKSGSTLNVKFGAIKEALGVTINGVAQESIAATDEGKTVNYTSNDGGDAVIIFTTASNKTVVFKQIMIDEDIATVILPQPIAMPTAAENGTVVIPKQAYPGDVVTIVATPDNGYELDAITVTGKGSNNAYEVNADNQFTMPDEGVNISVTFKQVTAINGVAESETEVPANVKIIKNGQLYIGKYNVAGQLVK